MMEPAIFIVGAVAGFLLAAALLTWGRRKSEEKLRQEIHERTLALEQARESLVRAQTELEILTKGRAAEEETVRDLRETFDALAGKVLQASQEQFLELASTKMEASEKSAVKELEKRKEAIDHMVAPLQQNLEKLGDMTRQLESKREKAYGELMTQLGALSNTTRELLASSSELSTVLKGSAEARGRWGETALKNIVEMAGMTEHCDFLLQSSDDRGNRPDLIVKLPGGDLIPVDAKAPFVDYERYCTEKDSKLQEEHLKAHAQAMKGKVKELEKRDYARNLGGRIDFTVMFVPLEPMLSAAFRVNPDLQMDAMAGRVLIVTPVTLVALLRTVSIYWRQEQLAENADKVLEAATELSDRVQTFQGHLAKVGKGLESALKSYNSAVGSFVTRILPSGRRLEELGVAGSSKTSDEPKELEGMPRELPGD